MDPHLETTYRALIRHIPPTINLLNISSQTACKPCDHCAIIVPDRSKAKNGNIKTPYERIDLYPDFPAMKASAKAGCGLCRMIRKSIRSQWSIRPMEEWGVGPLREKEGLWDELFESIWDRKIKIHEVAFSVAKNVRDFTPGDSSEVQIAEETAISLGFEFGPETRLLLPDGSATYGDIGRVVSFKVFDSQDLAPEQNDSVQRLPATSALCLQNLEMISQWIGNCVTHHFDCKESSLSSEPWYPTRLLDVGPANGSVLPRLIETKEGEIKGHFAALSHMWGNMLHRPPLQTFKANYQEMISEIPWSQLPKNFADAVIVTRRIGLRYIWIDSLCIIQDDTADWKKEATTMHSVYRCAHVTIVATSATSTHDGFLSRDLESIPAVKIRYSTENTEQHFIISPQDDVESGSWLGDIESCPWNQRGWTMQERKLSTRMLHFCKNKLYFECQSSRKSEENEPITMPPGSSEWWKSQLPPDDAAYEDSQAYWADYLYRRWARTVVEYTQRNLTRSSDKLIAIQSIASHLQQRVPFPAKYIKYAGMWQLNLKQELMWHAKDGSISRPNEYRAPTWSWASIDAKIGCNYFTVPPDPSLSHLNTISFEILDISNPENEPHTENFLKVRAFLRPLSAIIECENDDRWVYGTRIAFPYDIFVQSDATEELRPDLTFQERQKAIAEGKHVKFAEGRLDLDDQDRLTRSQRRLFYLHMNYTHRPSGLIVEAMDETGRYERVGIATMFEKMSELFLPSRPDEEYTLSEVVLI